MVKKGQFVGQFSSALSLLLFTHQHFINVMEDDMNLMFHGFYLRGVDSSFLFSGMTCLFIKQTMSPHRAYMLYIP